MVKLLVVGSVALDSVKTPFGQEDDVLGGSASFFATAASYFTEVSVIAVVGEDFPELHLAFLRQRGIDLTGLERRPGKTFRWRGEYSYQLNEAKTIATLLPGTAFFLGVPYAPARRLLERGLAVALASDCNPGTCPTENLPLIGAMACTQMRMLPAEVVAAMTLNAAAALGRSDRLGSIAW